MAEKLITAMVMPVGLVFWWLLGLTICLILERQRKFIVIVLCCLGTHYLFSCGAIANILLRYWERDFEIVVPENCDRFDYVVLLGGGSKGFDKDKLQLTTAGDRLMLAARLYHTGKIHKLLLTGSNQVWVDEEFISPADATRAIFKELKIPDEDMVNLKGRNTYEEMQSLKRMLNTSGDAQIGLITSATHMPRAIRLGKSQGINFSPFAADFRGNSADSILDFFPSYVGLERSSIVLKELLAHLVSR